MIRKDLLTPVDAISSDDGDPQGVRAFAARARDFMLSHQWCEEITAGYLGLGLPGVLGVFLFEIVPSRPGIDRELWVVAGDLPPAYIVSDDAPGPLEALRAYVSEMGRWVDAVRCRRSLEGVIPVNGAPTVANAEQLEGRLNFIKSEILDTA